MMTAIHGKVLPHWLTTIVAALALATTLPTALQADEQAPAAETKKAEALTLADGKLTLTPPADWKRQKPASRIVEHEFSAPAAEGDAVGGRVTMMGAGGSVEDNLKRWQAQFSGTVESKSKQLKIAGCDVHLLDLTGNYLDRPGPQAPAKERSDYRMIGAVVVTPKFGKYFIKMYGPKKTIAGNEKGFMDLIDGMKLAAE